VSGKEIKTDPKNSTTGWYYPSTLRQAISEHPAKPEVSEERLIFLAMESSQTSGFLATPKNKVVRPGSNQNAF
jgi:hypothetical protein